LAMKKRAKNQIKKETIRDTVLLQRNELFREQKSYKENREKGGGISSTYRK